MENGVNCTWIEVDEIRRHILYFSQDNAHIDARTALGHSLNIKIENNWFINQTELSKVIFNDRRKMNIYKEIINPEILNEIKRIKSESEWIILIEWAMLIEDGMLALTDNNIVLFEDDGELQMQRLAYSDLGQDEINKRISFTGWVWFEKREKIIKQTQKDRWCWIYCKIKPTLDDEWFKNFFEKILSNYRDYGNK